MEGSPRFLLLAAFVLLFPGATGEVVSAPESVCEASGRCSSLIQSNQEKTRTKTATTSDAETLKSTPEKVPLSALEEHAAVQQHQHHQSAPQLFQQVSELQTGSVLKTVAADNMLILGLSVALVVIMMIGGMYLLHANATPKGNASPQSPGRAITASRPSMQGGGSMPPSARAVPAAPRPSQSRPSSSMSPAAWTRDQAEPSPAKESPRLSTATSLFLCPELVVPDMTECTLMLPRISDKKDRTQVSIDDTRGVSVFRAEFTKKAGQDGTRLMLSSPAGDVTFAFCRDSEAAKQLGSYGGTSAALAIYSQKDKSKPFGLIRVKEDGTFEVMTSRGQCIRFQGRWPSGSLNALDEQGQLLALSDPAPDGPGGVPRRTVRIGPLVDAGLMAISYLGIDVLQLESSKTPTFSGSRFS